MSHWPVSKKWFQTKAGGLTSTSSCFILIGGKSILGTTPSGQGQPFTASRSMHMPKMNAHERRPPAYSRPGPQVGMPRGNRPLGPPGMRPHGPGGDYAPGTMMRMNRPPPPGGNFPPRFNPPWLSGRPPPPGKNAHPWFGWQANNAQSITRQLRPEIPGAPVHSLLGPTGPGSTWYGGGDADSGEWQGGS